MCVLDSPMAKTTVKEVVMVAVAIEGAGVAAKIHSAQQQHSVVYCS